MIEVIETLGSDIVLNKTRRQNGVKIETEVYINMKTGTIMESIVLSSDERLPPCYKDDHTCVNYFSD